MDDHADGEDGNDGGEGDGRGVDDNDQGAKDGEPVCQDVLDVLGNHKVDLVKVFGETVDDPAQRGRVEKSHRRGQDVPENEDNCWSCRSCQQVDIKQVS